MASDRPWKIRKLARSIRIYSAVTGGEICSIALSAYMDNTRHFEDAELICKAVNTLQDYGETR